MDLSLFAYQVLSHIVSKFNDFISGSGDAFGSGENYKVRKKFLRGKII